MLTLKYFPKNSFDKLLELSMDSVVKTRLYADMCRVNTLYMIKNGGSGHIGTSFSAMDIIAWLYLNRSIGDINSTESHELFFSSKGHDAPAHYSVMLSKGLLDYELIHKLRKLRGLPGHPDICTDNIITNTGSLGMGVSKAKGMLKASDLDKRQLEHVFVLTGDGELQEGQFWESLASAANTGEGRLTVIVDHNKIQSDTLVSLVSDLGDLRAKFESFGWHVQYCDGHDMKEFAHCVNLSVSNPKQPGVIIADTVKGKGVSFMEPEGSEDLDTLYGFHSGAPSDEEYSSGIGELLDSITGGLRKHGYDVADIGGPEEVRHTATPGQATRKQKLVQAYADSLLKAADKHPELVVLDADLMLDCGLIPFRTKHPERFVECGIAEQDMVSQAGGLALAGKLPVVHSFSCFLSTRPNEQIYNNATERTKIIYTAPLAGLIPGGTGHSHQSVRDISALGGVPGLVMVAPGTESEVKRIFEHCVNPDNEHSYFMRLTSVPWEISYQDSFADGVAEGRGAVIKDGSDGVIISYGPVMLSQAWSCAGRLLREDDIDLAVVNLPWLNCVDVEWLLDLVHGTGAVFTLDDHYKKGGQGEMIAAAIAESERERNPKVHRFGLSEIPECGSNEEVLKHHGLDADSLHQTVRNILQKTKR